MRKMGPTTKRLSTSIPEFMLSVFLILLKFVDCRAGRQGNAENVYKLAESNGLFPWTVQKVLIAHKSDSIVGNLQQNVSSKFRKTSKLIPFVLEVGVKWSW